MFKKAVIHLDEPPCLCMEQKLVWTVNQTQTGPSLMVWCQDCGTRVVVPNQEFKAVIQVEKAYPGKRAGAGKVEVVERKDIIDLEQYLRKRREGPPS